jgi:hypothetical protein
LQTKSLNSVAIVREDGMVLAVSPAALRRAGSSVKTDWGHKPSRYTEVMAAPGLHAAGN